MKRLSIILTVAALLYAGCKKDDDSGLPLPTDGLVAHYPLDGNVVSEVGGPTGELVGGALFTEDRKGDFGKAVLLDGINDYVKIPHDNKVNFNNDQEFCVSVWVKLDAQRYELEDRSTNEILSKWTVEGNAPTVGYPFVFRVRNSISSDEGKIFCGRHSTNVARDCDSPSSAVNGEVVINDNSFHHILFQKRSNQLYLYIDGVLDSIGDDLSGSGGTDCSTQTTAPLLIGARSPWSSNPIFHHFLTGAVDELRIYNRHLSQEEIKILANDN